MRTIESVSSSSAALGADRAVVDLDRPAAAALADQLVADPEAVAPGPLGVDRVGERAEEQVGIDRQPEPGELAGPGVLGEPAQRQRLAPLAAEAQPAAGAGPESGWRRRRARPACAASVSIAKASPFSSPPGSASVTSARSPVR